MSNHELGRCVCTFEPAAPPAAIHSPLKPNIALVHTSAEPPNQGRIALAIIGCTRNSNNELAIIVPEKRIRGSTSAIIANGTLEWSPKLRQAVKAQISSN